MQSSEHVDVLIIGAGISGIGAAHHLQEAHPGRTYAILEMRDVIGGTWDLFRYPGIRSDSDMHTLGYRFRPWTDGQSIADGPKILDYVRDTARDGDIERHIRFGHKVLKASWSTPDARWTVEAEHAGEPVTLTAGFVYSCSGYYRYDEGYTPEFTGIGDFEGQVIHPQHWPEDLDYEGKKVVVIGSGATAVTLVPAMAKTGAGHVTMLQRSPTYIATLPQKDPLAAALRGKVPEKAAYAIVRWKNVAITMGSYQLSRRRPRFMKALLRKGVARQLPEDYLVDVHFKPRYDPWDQRLCVVPNGDLFRSIRKGKASIVTDTIETFTKTGIRLTSGEELEADIVVTATGLNLLAFGGMELEVDGEPVRINETMSYKSMMLSGVPNFVFALGYTNASWTLKVDLVSAYLCRMLAHMDARGYKQAMAVRDPGMREEPFMDFQAGYVLRSLDAFPKQGEKAPWRLAQNYMKDAVTLRFGKVDGPGMVFSTPPARPAAVTRPEEPAAV